MLTTQTIDESNEFTEAGSMTVAFRVSHLLLLWGEQAPSRICDGSTYSRDEPEHPECSGTGTREPPPPGNQGAGILSGFACVISIAGRVSGDGGRSALGQRKRLALGSGLDVIMGASQCRGRHRISRDTRLCSLDAGETIGQILRLSDG